MTIEHVPGLIAAASQAANTAAPWWGPMTIQVIGTLVGSLGGVAVGAHLVGRRETATREQQRTADALYLTVTISGMLEEFTSNCADVAADDGLSRGQRGPDGHLHKQVQDLHFDYSGVEVVWRSLPGELLDQVHSIPRRLENIRRNLTYLANSDGDDDDYFAKRMRSHAELGLHAATVSKRLRTAVGLSPMIDPESNAVPWLEEMLAERKRIDDMYEKQQREMWTELTGRSSTIPPSP
ncbi:hypothetical protein [Stenotrophomonas indicatrix]|jgi:hypothetical protein|uniref:hypothetical protein n=1 Tax=Stenotrophomonas indicatrix TaxID=2045451 RepID=UPI00047286FE|nr:hypothetical protein [Stenotrophomonas indicatrix]